MEAPDGCRPAPSSRDTTSAVRARSPRADTGFDGGGVYNRSMSGLGRTLARLVGLTYTILGLWVFIINVIQFSYSGWTLVWILVSGVLGAVGGVFYLLSFDGPDRIRTRRTRFSGWVGMLVLALLPWSYSFVVLPMLLLTIPTLVVRRPPGDSRS